MFENMNFLKDAKIVRVANAAAGGQTTLTTSAVDTQGFNSVVFVAALGAVTDASVLTLSVLTNPTNSNSGGTAAADTATLTAASSSNGLMAIEANKPRQRYAYATLGRATQNAAVDGIFAILFNAQERPVTQDATLLSSKFTNDEA